jgi:GNAT superfamily N-acetyltransferase
VTSDRDETTMRELRTGDEVRLEAFLVQHRDGSVFLRSNARNGGLRYEGKPEQATYVATLRGDCVTGVVALAWNGMLLVQAPDGVEALARRCVALSGREATGVSGPGAQVEQAIDVLGLRSRVALTKENERLFAVDLTDVSVPDALSSGAVVCRPPIAAELPLLYEWRAAYNVETLGAEPGDANLAGAKSFLDRQIARGDAWVVVTGGELVSLSAFNASLPDIVQLGGIYTPPLLRGRGWGRVGVAAALLAARDRGAERAVLFTNNPAAVRCYESVGFRRIADYGLVLFR